MLHRNCLFLFVGVDFVLVVVELWFVCCMEFVCFCFSVLILCVCDLQYVFGVAEEIKEVADWEVNVFEICSMCLGLFCFRTIVWC